MLAGNQTSFFFSPVFPSQKSRDFFATRHDCRETAGITRSM